MAYTIAKSRPTPYAFVAAVTTDHHTEVRPAEHQGLELNFDCSSVLPMKLGLHDMELKPQQLVLFDARQEHVELHKQTTLAHKSITLDNTYLDSFFGGHAPALEKYRLISSPEVIALAQKLHQLSSSPYIPLTLYENLCDELTLQIFTSSQLKYHPALVKRAKKHLYDAIESPEFNLSRLAEEFGMSKFHFLRSFSAVEGISPIKYLRKLRAEWIGLRLVRENSSVIDTAYAGGFTSLSSFYETFNNVMKCSPKDFLNQVAAHPNRVETTTYRYLTVPV